MISSLCQVRNMMKVFLCLQAAQLSSPRLTSGASHRDSVNYYTAYLWQSVVYFVCRLYRTEYIRIWRIV